MADGNIRVQRLEELRQRTRPLHRQAERTGIIAGLLTGGVGRQDYALYLRNLLPAYLALEAGLEHNRSSPILVEFALPQIYRSASIESDLFRIAGDAWRGLALASAATAYAHRVTEVAGGDCALLVAHAYVRYLGDLSGGQILRSVLQRTVGLTDAEVSFLTFPLVADQNALKLRLLEAIERAGALCDWGAVMAEAELAFRLNIAVSTAVSELAPGT